MAIELTTASSSVLSSIRYVLNVPSVSAPEFKTGVSVAGNLTVSGINSFSLSANKVYVTTISSSDAFVDSLSSFNLNTNTITPQFSALNLNGTLSAKNIILSNSTLVSGFLLSAQEMLGLVINLNGTNYKIPIYPL